jgi:hypothetical protein
MYTHVMKPDNCCSALAACISAVNGLRIQENKVMYTHVMILPTN